jgi:hypothetical protein
VKTRTAPGFWVRFRSVASPPSPPRPRRVPPEQALPEPQLGASQAIGVAALTGTVGAAGGTAALAAGTAPAVPALLAAGETLEAVLSGLLRFRVTAAGREDAWLIRRLRTVEGLSQQDVLDVIADERARRGEFDRRQEARIRAQVGQVFAVPIPEIPDGGDPQLRSAARQARLLALRQRRDQLRAILHRERVYAEQRGEAIRSRTESLIDRTVLRRESPAGAYWVFRDDERTTPDCRAMGGRFWPWEALAVLHPQTHYGCRCALESLAWVRENRIPVRFMDVDEAVRAAHAARALLHENESV